MPISAANPSCHAPIPHTRSAGDRQLSESVERWVWGVHFSLMKTINLWVYNRKDGVTTFGVYWNAKRHVFDSARTKDGFRRIADELSRRHPIKFRFRGDPLPRGWKSMVARRVLAN